MQHFPLQNEFSEFPLFGVFSYFCTGGGSARLKTTSPRMRAPCARKPATSATGQTRDQPRTPETQPQSAQAGPQGTKSAQKAPNRPRRRQAVTQGAKSAQKAPYRRRRRQAVPEGAKPSHKAPNRPRRRQIGPEGTKPSHKEIGPENKHRPATAQPHARQGAQAKAEATQPTHESKRANMKQTMKHLTRVLRISSGNDTGFMNQIHLARRWQDHVKTIRKYQ